MLAALAFLALATKPVVCDVSQVYEAPETAVLYRVRSAVRQADILEGSLECSDRGGCRRKAHLVAGDPVVASHQRGAYACVWFRPVGGRTLGTYGWVRLADLEPAPAAPARWTGRWKGVADQALTIRPAKSTGRIRVQGSATWSASPEAAARGAINFGDLNDDFFVFGDRAEVYRDYLGPTQPLKGRWREDLAACAVKMRQLGPYLLVSDNYRCGGNAVTFSGLYRRQG